MPLTQQQAYESDLFNFCRPGECRVFVGPCSVTPWIEPAIALDGRHYRCTGSVFLRTGQELFANLYIQTHSFDFLQRDSVWVRHGDIWYHPDEPELYAALGVAREDALPYTWLPNPPLAYHKKGPYPMYGPEEAPDAPPASDPGFSWRRQILFAVLGVLISFLLAIGLRRTSLSPATAKFIAMFPLWFCLTLGSQLAGPRLRPGVRAMRAAAYALLVSTMFFLLMYWGT